MQTLSSSKTENTSSSDTFAYYPRHIGAVNWIGLQTLFEKEVARFLKVHMQTVWAPIVTTILYFMVFNLAFGGEARMINGVPYMQFLIPGLIIMSMVQNAFSNTSSSLVISKIQGNIVDILMPPLSNLELCVGMVAGGVTRGVCLGVMSVTVMAFVAHLPIHNVWLIIIFAVLGSMMMSSMGIIAGIWADKFDHIAAFTNFFVMPMTFLSGTFFSLQDLPPVWQKIALLNPFFYLIDGFRAGFIGTSDTNIVQGLIILIGFNIALFATSLFMLVKGYKIKS